MHNHSNMNSSVPLEQASGSLHSYIPGITASPTDRGYSKTSITYRLCLLRDLDQWIRQRWYAFSGEMISGIFLDFSLALSRLAILSNHTRENFWPSNPVSQCGTAWVSDYACVPWVPASLSLDDAGQSRDQKTRENPGGEGVKNEVDFKCPKPQV